MCEKIMVMCNNKELKHLSNTIRHIVCKFGKCNCFLRVYSEHDLEEEP